MIYFLEDDDNIRKLVSYALNKERYVVKSFGLPEEFWKELRRGEERPELILLDIMLPGEDGLSILKKLQRDGEYRSVPIVMLTAKGSEFDKVTGLDMGADDYIAKPFGITELVSRIRAVLRRYAKTKQAENAHYKIGSLYVEPDKHKIQVGGKDISLSYKEYQLLLLLLEAEGRVVRRDELLCRIWGEYYEESRTLDVHIRKLRVKLSEAGSLIKTVKNVGYRLGGEENE